jgi:transcriptional regulator with XRE-family HTH domain
MTFSEIVREERKKKNLTQKELANLMNIPTTTLSSWERGQSNWHLDKAIEAVKILKPSPAKILKLFYPNFQNAIPITMIA